MKSGRENPPADASDWIAMLATPLPVTAATDFVAESTAGGINIFLGTTRSEKSPANLDLVALDYESYDALAMKQLTKLAIDARERWPIVKLAILHRTGRVELAEPSVLIAVSTPHRVESFEAARYIIDHLKQHVAIWKKKVWADGAATW